jgi:hypothetical protein
MKHLLCSQRTAGVTAHAIGNDGEGDPAAIGMGKKSHTILLFLAVTLMLGNTGVN